jgi:excisionase family DNA binding protein
VADTPLSPPPDERGDLLTLQEGADECRVDYETFRRWVAKGVLPHVVVGPFKLKRVYRRDVDRLIRPGPQDPP